MELCNVLKAQEDGAGGGKGKKDPSETNMDVAHPDDEEDENATAAEEETGPKMQGQDMAAEEQCSSEAAAAKETAQSHMSH